MAVITLRYIWPYWSLIRAIDLRPGDEVLSFGTVEAKRREAPHIVVTYAYKVSTMQVKYWDRTYRPNDLVDVRRPGDRQSYKRGTNFTL